VNELIGLNGFRYPKKVTLKLYAKVEQLGRAYNIWDYQSKYYFSANKSTPAMIENAWDAINPKYGQLFQERITQSPYSVDVTAKFKAALDRVKNNNGRYEIPRMSFAFDDYYKSTGIPPWIWSSEHSSWSPRLIVQY
jgi:hypothetical protein